MADTRSTGDLEKTIRARGVVAIARRGELFLAIRRGPTLRAGGQVCFPGGHVEAGESDHEAVVRECLEELAAPVKPLQSVWQSVTDWGTALAWWTVELDEAVSLVPDPIEVADIFWLTLEQLASHPDLLPGNRDFLRGVSGGVIRL